VHNPEEQARYGDDVLEEITIANVEDFRNDRLERSIQFVIRHPDLPEGISAGCVYLPVSLPRILQASAAAISACVGSLETGVSEAGGAALPSNGVRRSVHSAGMVVAGLVRDSEVRR
jgi:hypothetical protein